MSIGSEFITATFTDATAPEPVQTSRSKSFTGACVSGWTSVTD